MKISDKADAQAVEVGAFGPDPLVLNWFDARKILPPEDEKHMKVMVICELNAVRMFTLGSYLRKHKKWIGLKGLGSPTLNVTHWYPCPEFPKITPLI